jgi:hypothetical protein
VSEHAALRIIDSYRGGVTVNDGALMMTLALKGMR